MRQAPCASSMKEIMFESIKNLEGGLVRHRYRDWQRTDKCPQSSQRESEEGHSTRENFRRDLESELTCFIRDFEKNGGLLSL
jgi:hypothetical protein